MGLEGAGKPEIAQQDADGDSADHLESGLMPGLNTDHFHTAARELLFQHNSHGVPVAFQSHNDVAAVGLPQINIFNSSNQTELHTDVKNNLAPYDNKTVPLHDALPAPADGKQPSYQNGEIKVENYVVKKGDSLWKIARENLPQGASNRVVANYVHQIEADNPMPNPNLIMPEQIIKLRSYAPLAEHDTVHGAERHGTPEHYHDSRQHEHYHTVDHHTENAKPNPAKENKSPPIAPPPSQSDKPTPAKDAPRPPVNNNDADDDKSTLKTTLPKDQKENLLEPFKDTPVALNIEQDRRQLAELAHSRMGDSSEYHRFADNMHSFEHRANSEIAEKLRLQGKSPEETVTMVTQEIHDTYKNAGDLLRTPGTDKLTPVELQHLASEEMKQAAHPANIDQGQHPTCQTAVIEKRIYAREPSKATGVVTQVALTGKYTAPDGTTVSIDPRPHDGEANMYPVKSGERSLASQIFEETAINVTWEKLYPGVRYEWQDANHALRKAARYQLMLGGKEVTTRDGQAIRLGDTGIFRTDWAIMSNIITGKHEKSIVIPFPNSPQELNAEVQELKKTGGLPAVLEVNASDKPFSAYAEGPGFHTVLIDDYISAKNGHSAEAMVDNSWGFAPDGSRLAAGLMNFQLLYHVSAKVTDK